MPRALGRGDVLILLHVFVYIVHCILHIKIISISNLTWMLGTGVHVFRSLGAFKAFHHQALRVGRVQLPTLMSSNTRSWQEDYHALGRSQFYSHSVPSALQAENLFSQPPVKREMKWQHLQIQDWTYRYHLTSSLSSSKILPEPVSLFELVQLGIFCAGSTAMVCTAISHTVAACRHPGSALAIRCTVSF